MTIRNVRAHQSRGLLPPPTVRGRVGYYGADHLDRLRTIRQMQDEGFNLSAIASVLAAGHETADRLRRLHPRTLIELDVGPRAELSPEGIAVIRGRKAGAHLDALVDAGVIRELPDGGYAAATPALLAAGRRLNALDIGWERQLVALLALIDLAQQAADGVPKVADELCGADCDDAAVLDEARAWITEVVRAVLDRSIASRVGASRT
jgi:DNA-binding transcriptional MerR regulator